MTEAQAVEMLAELQQQTIEMQAQLEYFGHIHMLLAMFLYIGGIVMAAIFARWFFLRFVLSWWKWLLKDFYL